MSFLFEIFFMLGIIAAVFFGACAENRAVGSNERRDYIIISMFSLIVTVICVVIIAKI